MPESAKKSSTTKKPTAQGTSARRKNVSKVLCAVCQLQVVDGKDEALFCEGECSLWYHRGCASVPPELYKTLSNSDEPFVCLSCSSSHFKQQIADLSATVVALKEELKDTLEIRETCSALAREVSALRQALNSLEKEVSKPRQAKHTYAAALSSRSKSSQSISKLASTAPTASSSGAPQNKRQLKNNESKPSEPKHKVKVEGARRIWGTMRACSPGAITAIISRLVSERLELRIKRKTKQLANNKTIWWFVVHGTERDLVLLEQGWEKVKTQTSWTLEHCLMSPNVSSSQTPLPNAHAPVPSVTEGPLRSEGSTDTDTTPGVVLKDDGPGDTPTHLNADKHTSQSPTSCNNAVPSFLSLSPSQGMSPLRQ